MPFPIEARNICVSYEGEPILLDISFRICSGENICLLGPSGCGKTTLLKVFAGLEEPSSGQILYNGQDIYNIREKEYLKYQEKTSVLFQGGALLANMTVFDNIALPLRYHAKIPEETLQQMVHAVAQPYNLISKLDKRPAVLSLGARKLAALARTFITTPEIIFFDDPTGIMDRASAETVLQEIRSKTLDHSISTIISTGDIEIARQVADRVVILYDGRLLADGTLDEISGSDDPFIRKILKTIEQV